MPSNIFKAHELFLELNQAQLKCPGLEKNLHQIRPVVPNSIRT